VADGGGLLRPLTIREQAVNRTILGLFLRLRTCWCWLPIDTDLTTSAHNFGHTPADANVVTNASSSSDARLRLRPIVSTLVAGNGYVANAPLLITII